MNDKDKKALLKEIKETFAQAGADENLLKSLGALSSEELEQVKQNLNGTFTINGNAYELRSGGILMEDKEGSNFFLRSTPAGEVLYMEQDGSRTVVSYDKIKGEGNLVSVDGDGYIRLDDKGIVSVDNDGTSVEFNSSGMVFHDGEDGSTMALKKGRRKVSVEFADEEGDKLYTIKQYRNGKMKSLEEKVSFCDGHTSLGKDGDLLYRGSGSSVKIGFERDGETVKSVEAQRAAKYREPIGYEVGIEIDGKTTIYELGERDGKIVLGNELGDGSRWRAEYERGVEQRKFLREYAVGKGEGIHDCGNDKEIQNRAHELGILKDGEQLDRICVESDGRIDGWIHGEEGYRPLIGCSQDAEEDKIYKERYKHDVSSTFKKTYGRKNKEAKRVEQSLQENGMKDVKVKFVRAWFGTKARVDCGFSLKGNEFQAMYSETFPYSGESLLMVDSEKCVISEDKLKDVKINVAAYALDDFKESSSDLERRVGEIFDNAGGMNVEKLKDALKAQQGELPASSLNEETEKRFNERCAEKEEQKHEISEREVKVLEHCAIYENTTSQGKHIYTEAKGKKHGVDIYIDSKGEIQKLNAYDYGQEIDLSRRTCRCNIETTDVGGVEKRTVEMTLDDIPFGINYSLNDGKLAGATLYESNGMGIELNPDNVSLKIEDYSKVKDELHKQTMPNESTAQDKESKKNSNSNLGVLKVLREGGR